MRGYQLNEVFAACPPGLESALMGELQAMDLPLSEPTKKVNGGVELRAADRRDWMHLLEECNLRLRCATRVLARLARLVRDHSFLDRIRQADTPQDLLAVFGDLSG